MDRAQQAARALGFLSRAAEMRRSAFGEEPPNWQRLLAEAQSGLQAACEQSRLSLIVAEGGLFAGADLVLEEKDERSIPAILRRDGILELAIDRKISTEEIGAFVDDIAASTEFRGLTDDAYTRLWRRRLPHIRLSTADDSEDPTIREELDAVVQEIFGDYAASIVSERSAGIPRAPGRLTSALASELEPRDPRTCLALARDAAIAAFSASLAPADVEELFRGVIQVFDALLANHDLESAGGLITAARNARAASERIDLFLEEALNEARTRAVLAIHKELQTEETFKGIVEFFRGLGPRASPLIFHLLPSLVEADQRRQLSNVLIEIGEVDLDRLKPLLSNDLGFVVQEGLYLLSRLDNEAARAMLTAVKESPRPDVRAALAEVINTLEGEAAFLLAEELLRDPHTSVRIKVVQALAKMNDKHAAKMIEAAVSGPAFEDSPLEQKRAYFEAYAISSQVRALLLLSKYMKKADGLLVKKEAEELGVAAVEAMGHIPTPRTIEFLKEAAVMKNKRVRDTAREVLQRFKEKSA